MGLTSDQAVEALRAAAESTRLRILALLAHEEMAVLELSRVLGQSQPRVSRHLKLLADAGLVERFPDGAWVFYRLISGGPLRALVEQALATVSPDDASFRHDAERLKGVSAERAAAATAYFADNADRWDEIRSLYTSESAVEAAIIAAAGEGPFERLVDLGAGTGRMLTLLGARARRSSGLDLSRQMLNIARGNVAAAGLAACELRHGDIFDTRLDDGTADLVVVHQVLHYLGEPAAAVAEAARLVALGGRLIIVDFAPHGLEFLRSEHRHRRLGFADDEIGRWLEGSGLGEVSVTALPPPAAGGLTVKIWRALRPADRVRRVA
ncbi:MAG TPA: metalloregulator ArsR/SmtB family transcription factor [Caulobacteraceae bacterium]|jgi:ArsR family transcriptional regulator|nr:metalloregulator ArsR/SmtB family transcription factor [Caulobacteraceae bacterium]